MTNTDTDTTPLLYTVRYSFLGGEFITTEPMTVDDAVALQASLRKQGAHAALRPAR